MGSRRSLGTRGTTPAGVCDEQLPGKTLNVVSRDERMTPRVPGPLSVSEARDGAGPHRQLMESEVVEAELVLPTHLSFKKVQMYEKYPKGQSRGRHWKHLKQILQAENFQNYPPDEPNYVNIESPPSMHPSMKICDITGLEAPYHDPRTNLRYANTEVFKQIRALPNEYVQRYLALRNAAVVLK